MMLNKLFPVTVLFLLVLQAKSQKKVAFTIDDLPAVYYSLPQSDHQQMITDQLLETCQRFRIPAMGFVNEQKLYQAGVLDSFQVKLLDQWLISGCELGNHSYAHKSYHKTAFNEYTADIIKGEKVTKQLFGSQKSPDDLLSTSVSTYWKDKGQA